MSNIPKTALIICAALLAYHFNNLWLLAFWLLASLEWEE